MNIIVHAAAGALVGQTTGNPMLAFIYGILSHIILDLIPHGDSHLYQQYIKGELSKKGIRKAMAETVLDAIGAVILVLAVFNLNLYFSKLVISMAILGAIIPDVMIGFYELWSPKAPKILKTIHKWHFKGHDLIAKKYDLSWKNGKLLQLLIFLILLKLL